MIADFSNIPFTRITSRYEDRRFLLHALTMVSGHSREVTREYYHDGKRHHAPAYTVWQYTIGGRGRLDKKWESADILPGTLMILTVPGEEIYYLPENSDHWEFVFLTMVGEDSIRTIKTTENRIGNIIPGEEIPKTMELFQDFLHELFSNKINNPFINSSRSYALCMALLEETGNKGIPEKLDSFDDLVALLVENIHRDFPVEEMAGIMRLSRSHFTRLFTQHTGMSPRRFMEYIRLKTAVSLLQNESISIKEAAGRVGITSENYFCRIFKKQYGLSPGKIRNKKYWRL